MLLEKSMESAETITMKIQNHISTAWGGNGAGFFFGFFFFFTTVRLRG
jgi:hypothetical protein